MPDIPRGRLDDSHLYRVFTFVNDAEKAAILDLCAKYEVSVSWVIHYALRKFLFDSEDEA